MLIVFPFLKYSMKIIPHSSQKTDAMTLPADVTVIAFFEADSPFNLLLWLSLRLGDEVCFIHGYELTQKLNFIVAKHR